MKTMSFSLHPAVATLAALFLVISYLYGGYLITSINDEGTFDVQTVVASLLAAEAAVGQCYFRYLYFRIAEIYSSNTDIISIYHFCYC